MRRTNKRGSGSVILSIILSALILIEGLYLGLIIDINRRITIERALKLQLESILATYNQELFDNYGFYGFLLDDVDDYVFRKTLEATGFDYGEYIYIYGYRTINTVQIKDAISNYYAYRAPGLLMEQVLNVLEYAIDELDNYDFISNLKRFKANGGNTVLNWLSEGAETISDILSSDELQELLDDAGIEGSQILNFLNTYKEYSSSDIDFDDDFDSSEMFGMNFFDRTIEFYGDSSNFIKDNTMSLFLSHYIAYNFESNVLYFENNDGEFVEDMNLHGTKFTELNPNRSNEVEYILTGFNDNRGILYVGFMIFPIIQLIEVLNLLMDKEFMDGCKTVAEILSTIFTILLEGVSIPEWVFELIIIQYSSLAVTISDMVDLYDGKTINALKIDSAPEPFNKGIKMDYKDFLFLLSLPVTEEKKLHRIDDILEGKYGDFITSIDLYTTYKGENIYGELGYELYGF